MPSGAVVAERELSDQPASLRTHMLLTIGPCLFTLVSADGFHGGAIHPSPPGRPDRHRHPLPGGAILRHGLTSCSMTTAANIRATTLIGVTVGVGRYLRSTGATVLVIGTMAGLRIVRDQLPNWSWVAGGVHVGHRGWLRPGAGRRAGQARGRHPSWHGPAARRRPRRAGRPAPAPRPRRAAGEALSRLEGAREVAGEQ